MTIPPLLLLISVALSILFIYKARKYGIAWTDIIWLVVASAFAALVNQAMWSR